VALFFVTSLCGTSTACAAAPGQSPHPVNFASRCTPLIFQHHIWSGNSLFAPTRQPPGSGSPPELGCENCAIVDKARCFGQVYHQ
jgi:hypothetical protein